MKLWKVLLAAMAALPTYAQANLFTILPTSGEGYTARFKVSYDTNLTSVYVLIGDTISPAQSCFFGYDETAEAPPRLVSEHGSEFMTTNPRGVLRNSRCRLLTEFGGFAGVSSHRSVIFTIVFAPAFTGQKRIWVFGAKGSSNTGWIEKGTWNIPAAAGPGSLWLSPTVANIEKGDFQATFHHREDASKHYLSYILFLPTDSHIRFTAAESCLIEYNRISNRVRIVNSAGTDWLPAAGAPIGPGGTILANGYCNVDTTRMAVLVEDEILRVNGNIRFSNVVAYPPLYATFLQAQDVDGRWTGMDQYGTWQVPGRIEKPSGLRMTAVGPTFAMSNGPISATVTQTMPGLGASDVTMIHFLLANTQTDQAKCQIVYFPQSNTVNLIDDTRTHLVATVSPVIGTGGPISNAACTIEPAKSSAFVAASQVHVSVWVSKTEAIGSAALFANAFDVRGYTTHWVQGGSFF